MELDFEIAVDQQTRARDRTFEGVPEFRCPPGQPRPYVVNFWPNFARGGSSNVLKKCTPAPLQKLSYFKNSPIK